MSEPLSTEPEPSPAPPAAPVRSEHKLFRSPMLGFGLVRVFLYIVLWMAISAVLLWISRPLLNRDFKFATKNLLITESAGLCATLGAAWIMSRLEKRPFGGYGLPGRQAFGKLFWIGAAFGLFEISAVIGGMAAFGAYHFGVLAVHGSELFRWALFWAGVFCLVGLSEEFSFRGYAQFTLSQGMGFWPAAVLLSLAFGWVHKDNPGETWVGLLGVVLTGLFWCFTLRRTGSLWFAVGMHAAFDFGETFLYSVPDSGYLFPGHLSNAVLSGPAWLAGGSAGPEASVFDFLVLLIFFYVFHRLYPQVARTPASTA
jgi:uncharacterized protein